MKWILNIVTFICCFNLYGQEIKSELIKTLDSETFQCLKDFEFYDTNSLLILAQFRPEDQANNDYFISLIDYNGNIIVNKKIFTPQEYVDLVVFQDGSFALIGFDTEDDENMTDYISFFDKEFKNISNIKLESSYEGNISGFEKENKLIVGTNNNKEYVLFRLNKNGKIEKKQKINFGFGESLEKIIPTENGINLYGWSLIDENNSKVDILKLSENFEIIDSFIMEVEEKMPVKYASLENSKSIFLWDSIVDISMVFDKDLKLENRTVFIRHDLDLFDACNYNSEILLYSGKLGENSGVFVIKEDKILSKILFGKIGIWGKTKVLKLNENEFIIATDQMRTHNFDTMINIYKIIKK